MMLILCSFYFSVYSLHSFFGSFGFPCVFLNHYWFHLFPCVFDPPWICIEHMARHALLTLFRSLSVCTFLTCVRLTTASVNITISFSLYIFDLLYLFSLSERLKTFFLRFVTAHASWWGTLLLPHVWVDWTNYTYKFASSFSIITTRVSLLLASWHHHSDDNPSPRRRLPTTPEPRSKIFSISKQ